MWLMAAVAGPTSTPFTLFPHFLPRAPEMTESEPLLANVSDEIPDIIEIPMTNAAQKVSGWASEFGSFISKGNVVDLAIGLIIGAAFSDIVKSLVGDIFSPLIGLATGVGF